MFFARNLIISIICLIGFKATVEATDLCASSPYSNNCVKLGQKSYLIDGNAMLNWFEAERLCRRQNGYLATIRNDNEMNAISNYMVSKGFLNGNQRYWIGGSDLGSRGKIYSVETGNLLSYARWASGQPNTNGNDNCVALTKQNNAFYMAIFNKNSKFHYVCELQDTPNESKKLVITYKYA